MERVAPKNSFQMDEHEPPRKNRYKYEWLQCREDLKQVRLLAFESRWKQTGRKEMFYLTMHSTHFIYGYMVSDIW